MSTQIDAVINLFAGTFRGWRGTQAMRPARLKPAKMLKLYDMEASPYCRLVREVLTELDLDVLILPCPAGGTRYRLEAEKIGGKQLFPMLVDDNTDTVLYESADIIEYLGRTYQRRVKGTRGFARGLSLTGSYLASALHWRPGGIIGMRARASRAPAQPLELYSFETSPYSKPVRARLCELELPYVLRNTGKGAWGDMGPPSFRDSLFKTPKGTTPNRRWLEQNTGLVQVPYLIDANTGTAMYESRAILKYLDTTYAL